MAPFPWQILLVFLGTLVAIFLAAAPPIALGKWMIDHDWPIWIGAPLCVGLAVADLVTLGWIAYSLHLVGP